MSSPSASVAAADFFDLVGDVLGFLRFLTN